MPRRSEEIYCPKCKARGYQLFSLGETNEIEYECKICKYHWKQPKLFNFIDNGNKDSKTCVCGGKYDFSKLHGATMRRMLKCNKCGNEKVD